MWRQPRRLPEGIKRAARRHRSEPTPAEARLWERLRKNQLADAGFRRQHPVGSFILDFYCPAHRLAVEVDGAIHEQQAEYDTARTESLAAEGIRVIRFRNEEVLDDLSGVLARIEAAITER